MKKILYLSFFAFVVIGIFSSITFQHFYCASKPPATPEFLRQSPSVLDSIESSMDLEQKLRICFMIKNDDYEASKAILSQHPNSGILLAHSRKEEIQSELHDLNLVQSVKTCIAIPSLDDFENSIGVPVALVRGAVTSSESIGMLGAAVGRELKLNGVDAVFSDDRLHTLSPTPTPKSYHLSFETAAEKCTAYQLGLVLQNKLLYISDFEPSNHENKKDRADFLLKDLRDGGLPALSLSSQIAGEPSFYSSKTLKDSLNFKGLLIRHLGQDINEEKMKTAILNADILLVNASNFQINFELALSCLQKNKSLQKHIEQSAHRVLMARSWMKSSVESNLKLKLDLNKRWITEQSLIYLGQKSSLPILDINKKKTLVISGDSLHAPFISTLKLYSRIDQRVFSQAVFKDSIKRLVAGYHYIIVLPSNKAMTGLVRDLASECSKKQLIIYTQTNSSALNELPKGKAAILFSLLSGTTADELSAQSIFGGVAIQGRLPYGFAGFKSGEGYSTQKIRLKYSIPEEVGIKAAALSKIDSLVDDGIRQKAFPGCQVLLAKDGIVFYRKAFGTVTYESKDPVTNDHIYDLASVTKIAGVVPSLMRLLDDGKFKLDTKISGYLRELRGTDKQDLLCRELLLHEAGLPAWMPYFSKIFTDKKNKTLKPEYFSTVKSKTCKLQISDHLFMNPSFSDSFLHSVYDVKLKEDKKYLYTDLAYYFLKEAVERITRSNLDRFTEDNFYAPLGANSLCYCPLRFYDKKQIVPTEQDKLIRNELIQGFVHDPGALLMGGIAGHAGLFSNANDLAKLMQLYLQMGTYGGYTYFTKKTILEFTQPKTGKESSRGIGFDKQRGGPIYSKVSPLSYGHTGFTGTVAWNDPANNLVYIFLSNRVYPDANNNKLLELATRKKIQEVVYHALNQ